MKFKINLRSGWNLISIPVRKFDMSPINIFNPIINKLIQIKNLNEIFNPSYPAFLNTLKRINKKTTYIKHITVIKV